LSFVPNNVFDFLPNGLSDFFLSSFWSLSFSGNSVNAKFVVFFGSFVGICFDVLFLFCFPIIPVFSTFSIFSISISYLIFINYFSFDHLAN